MGGFTNGKYPLSMMVKLSDTHYLPAGTAARWLWMVAKAKEKYGVTLRITRGWNAYRPYDVQVELKAELGKYAAWPGTSSHGLLYNGKEVAAIDVANWQDLAPGDFNLAWARFKALCRLAMFRVDWVNPQELWHIGDFNDIWTVPDFAKDVPDNNVPKEDEMILIESLPDRGRAVVGPGYYRKLRNSEELSQASKLVSRTLKGNARQFDVWKSIALHGSVPSKAITLTDDQLDQIAEAARSGGADAIKDLEFVVTASSADGDSA